MCNSQHVRTLWLHLYYLINNIKHFLPLGPNDRRVLSLPPSVRPSVRHAYLPNYSKSCSPIFIKLGWNIVLVNISVQSDNGQIATLLGQLWAIFGLRQNTFFSAIAKSFLDLELSQSAHMEI